MNRIVSSHSIWEFDAERMRFRRIPRTADPDAPAFEADWEPYHRLDLDEEAGAFTVVLNAAGTRQYRSYFATDGASAGAGAGTAGGSAGRRRGGAKAGDADTDGSGGTDGSGARPGSGATGAGGGSGSSEGAARTRHPSGDTAEFSLPGNPADPDG